MCYDVAVLFMSGTGFWNMCYDFDVFTLTINPKPLAQPYTNSAGTTTTLPFSGLLFTCSRWPTPVTKPRSYRAWDFGVIIKVAWERELRPGFRALGLGV